MRRMAAADVPSELVSLGDNRAVLRSLTGQLRSPSGVIPLVGAGLSAPYGLPTWSEFILAQASLAGLGTEVRTLIEQGDFETAAETLVNVRGWRRFEDAIEDAFGDHNLTAVPGVLDCGSLFHVLQIARGPVLTTNFDRLLERGAASNNIPFDFIGSGSNIEVAARILQQGKRVLLKLHGDWEDPTSRILTLNQYADFYGSEDPTKIDFRRPLPLVLRLALQNRPVLFVGCSLRADRTVHVLRQVALEARTLVQYAVLPLGKRSDFTARDRFLADLGIRVIWYPEGQHEHVESLLAHMSAQSKQSANPAEVNHGGKGSPRWRLWPTINVGADVIAPTHVSRTLHGEITIATVSGKPVLTKRTEKNLCSWAALSQIAGKQFRSYDGGVAAVVVAPERVRDGGEYIEEVLPFVEGVPLDAVMRRSGVSVTGNLLGAMYNSLLSAITQLHRAGVIHRDICPGNVLVSVRDKAVHIALIDCSFAWPIHLRDQVAVGTLNYAAPEQLEGMATVVSDLYSLAATIWYTGTGLVPYVGDQSEHERQLRAIDTGNYFAPPEFRMRSRYEREYRYGAFVLDALLEPDKEQRPSANRGIQLCVGTSVGRSPNDPVSAVLDVRPSGAVFFYRSSSAFTAVPAYELSDAVADAISARRFVSEDVRDRLKDLLKPT